VALWVFGLSVAAFLGYGIWTFNRLVGLSKRADAAWSDIDVHLKQRWDMVPALVNAVQGYAQHESSTLERVAEARSRIRGSASIQERSDNELNLSAAVARLFALAEAYPDLKASENFQSLEQSLVKIEDKIGYARRYYNAVVRDWNTLIEGIPSRWVATAAGYGERPYFQIDEAERAAPRVEFGASREPGATSDVPPPGSGGPG
jgi:LemA protein